MTQDATGALPLDRPVGAGVMADDPPPQPTPRRVWPALVVFWWVFDFAVVSGFLRTGMLGQLSGILWVASTVLLAVHLAVGVPQAAGRSRCMSLALLPLAAALTVCAVAALLVLAWPSRLFWWPPILRGLLTGGLALFTQMTMAAVPPRREAAASRTVGAVLIGPVAALAITFVARPALLWGDPAGRLASMLGGEDGAAWVGQVRAILVHGAVPGVNQSPQASMQLGESVGALGRMARHGTATLQAAPAAAVNGVFASWLCAMLVAMVAVTTLIILVVPRHLPASWETAAVAASGSSLANLTAASTVLALTMVGHLSLAWLGATLSILGAWLAVLSGCRPRGRAGRKGRLWVALSCLAMGMVGAAVSLAWPFGVASAGPFIVVAAVMLWRASAELPISRWAGPALVVGYVVPLVQAWWVLRGEHTGAASLLGASGSTVLIPVELLVILAGATMLGVALAGGQPARSPQWWILLLSLSTAVGALGILASRVVLPSAGTYARDKTTYLAVMMIAPLLAIALSALLDRLRGSMVAALSAITATALLLLWQTIPGYALAFTAGVGTEGTARAERMLSAAVAGSAATKINCLPSSAQEPKQNYYCQRWLSAFSATQPREDPLRTLYWNLPGAQALATAQSQKLLPGDAYYVDALAVMTGKPDQAASALMSR